MGTSCSEQTLSLSDSCQTDWEQHCVLLFRKKKTPLLYTLVLCVYLYRQSVPALSISEPASYKRMHFGCELTRCSQQCKNHLCAIAATSFAASSLCPQLPPSGCCPCADRRIAAPQKGDDDIISNKKKICRAHDVRVQRRKRVLSEQRSITRHKVGDKKVEETENGGGIEREAESLLERPGSTKGAF